LIDASSDTVAAFDNAISTMYPEQDESEITTAIRDLASKSRQTVQIVESRLKLGGMDESQSSARDQLSTFLAKWTDRLDSETKNWDERRLSLGALTKALP
jgi:transposase-like protein